MTAGALPTGLDPLNTGGPGAISGTPTTAGTFTFTVTATDASVNHCTGLQAYTVVAKLTTALTTQASSGVTRGEAISDTATLSGGATPTGTITFNLYGPNDATCSSAIFTSTVPVNGNGTYSSTSFTDTTAGTYRWIANYSGDANNAATANACNAANENVVVERGRPCS